MDVVITPSELTGTVTPPASKSLSHRALIAAYLAGSPETVSNLAACADTEATVRCMDALLSGDEHPTLDCGESGSTLRFLIPVALALRGGARFTGRGRLMERPQGPYFDIFREKGIEYAQSPGELDITGRLTPGTYSLRGDVSSQFVTGLLFALPVLEGDSEIVITTPLESREYVSMTLDVLGRFGIDVDGGDLRRISVPGGQRYTKTAYTVEADWSQAGFWYAARALGHGVELAGLDPGSSQGDRAVSRCCERLSVPGDTEIDVSQIPDLLPPLAVMAAAREGATLFSNAARLRLKESDRIATTAAMLRAFGVKCVEGPDFLSVTGTDKILGCTVDGANDHRIVMSAAVLATRADRPVTILGAEAVRKSYPGFFEDLASLGGVYRVL